MDKWMCFIHEVTKEDRIRSERRVLCSQTLKSILMWTVCVGKP